MTIKDILTTYIEELSYISDTPKLDIEILLSKALGDVDRLYIHLNLNKELTNEQLEYFNRMIQDRLNGRPIAYIVNNREFMGLDFYVEEGVLIPRPDTEPLVEEVIELVKDKEDLKIVDIGTGSGAITVSLARYIKSCEIYSLDISEKALDIGLKNAISNGVENKISF
ncbi:MAG: N5-glutamine methyltransferase family protein, partial [Paraclostridium sp.]